MVWIRRVCFYLFWEEGVIGFRLGVRSRGRGEMGYRV